MTKPVNTYTLEVTRNTDGVMFNGDLYAFHHSRKDQQILCGKCDLRRMCTDHTTGVDNVCAYMRDRNLDFRKGCFRKVRYKVNLVSGRWEGRP